MEGIPENIPEQPIVPEQGMSQKETRRVLMLEIPEIEEGLHTAFGLEVSIMKRVESGYASEVYEVVIGGEKAFVLFNKDKHALPVAARGHELFKRYGIPVPNVIAYEENPPAIECPTLILSAAEGRVLAEAQLSPEEEAAIYTEMGDISRRINEISVPGFGRMVVDEDGTVKGEFNSWKESRVEFQAYFDKNIEFLRTHRLLTEDELESLVAANEELKEIKIGQASLLHTDIHRGHVFVKDGKVSGIIDLGRLRAGDPREEVAECFVFQSDTQRDAFTRGYGDVAHDPIINKYIMVIAAMKTAFRHEIGNEKGKAKVISEFRRARQAAGI
ncbi:MAG TPA: aminoglycoside phosphotransferase family protein [Candidatus Paceibacterota bacterium]